MLSWKMVRIRRVMRDWPRSALSLKMKTTRETKATTSARVLGSWISARRSKVNTGEDDLRSVGPLVFVRDAEGTHPERIKWNIGYWGG